MFELVQEHITPKICAVFKITKYDNQVLPDVNVNYLFFMHNIVNGLLCFRVSQFETVV